MQATPIGKLGETVDLGTPSAPPFMDVGNVEDFEVVSEKSIDGQYKEPEQVFSGDKVFQESVKTETEVGERYDYREVNIFFGFFIILFHRLTVILSRDDDETLGERENPAPVRCADSVNHIPYYCARLYTTYILDIAIVPLLSYSIISCSPVILVPKTSFRGLSHLIIYGA